MALWYYSGKVTTPVDMPGQGPIVLRPRQRFEAPPSAVVHLVRAGLVVRLPDAQQDEPAPAEAPQERPADAPDPSREDPRTRDRVVASEPTEEVEDQESSDEAAGEDRHDGGVRNFFSRRG